MSSPNKRDRSPINSEKRSLHGYKPCSMTSVAMLHSGTVVYFSLTASSVASP